MSEINLRAIRNREFHNQSHKGATLMKLRKNLMALTIALALTTIPATMYAQNDTSPKGRLEGAWNAVLIADDEDFQQKERYTFATGRSVDEGSLVFANEFDAVPPCGASQGVWARTGSRQFTLTHGAFCSDLSTFTPLFRIKLREVITLSAKEDQFTGRGIFEVFDPSGVLLFSATYTVRGTRMAVEGLANSPGFETSDAELQPANPTRGEASMWRRWMKNLPR